MDLNKQVNEITEKVIGEKLPEMIEKHVSEMLNRIISDTFSSYGEAAKNIKKKIEEKLDVNLQRFDLVDYNALVAKAINDSIVQTVNIQPIMDLTRDAIGFINKKSITLSEIAEMLKQSAMGASDSYDGHISFYAKRNDEHGWIEVSLDPDQDKKESDCGLNFYFSTPTKAMSTKIFSFHTKDHWVNRGPVTPARLASLSSIEHKIFRLYSAQVDIIADDLDIETYWSKEGY